jgi:DNA-binding transcriptional ArsR family regulator
MPESKKPRKAQEEATSRLIYALNHPLRRQILKRLMRGPASASMLSKQLGIPLSNASYHVGDVLNQACKALTVVEEIPRRGATETVYRVKSSFLLGAIYWPAIPEPLRSGLRGLALNDFLYAAIASLEADAAPSKKGSSPRKDNGYYLYRSALADEDGQREISEAAEEFAEKVAAVEARCATVDPVSLLSLIVGVASFEAAPFPEPDAKE